MGQNMMDRVRAKYAYDNLVNGMAVQQLVADAAVIALNREFGFGAKRAAVFMAALIETTNEMANLICEDTDDTVYSRTKIDELLLSIVGPEQFTPWEERYAAQISPTRGNREQRRTRRNKGRR